MKRKLWLLAALVLVVGVLAGCNGTAGISQDEFDQIVAERDALKAEQEDLKSELNSISASLDDSQNDCRVLKEENDSLKQQIIDNEEEQATQDQGGLASAKNGVLVHNDDYVTISYLGCENDGSTEYMVFYVVNKTDAELTFQANTLAINGGSLGFVFGSDSIAAQSKGKVRYKTEEAFPTMSPDTITGGLKVVDFGKTLFGKQSYEVSFVNLSVE